MYSNVIAATALTLWLANGVTVAAAQPTTSVAWDEVKRLAQAAYFSETCRQEAAAFDVRTSDPDVLVAAGAAFARGRSAVLDARSGDCKTPVVLLVNLLRINGLDAELVFTSTTQMNTAGDIESADKIDRVLVYVTELARYLDPALPAGRQAAIDRAIREASNRIHFSSLNPSGRYACHDLCMRVVAAASAKPAAVRVRTETIRGR
jgi:hypothetical protein